jgi:hypothetical protein
MALLMMGRGGQEADPYQVAQIDAESPYGLMYGLDKDYG